MFLLRFCDRFTMVTVFVVLKKWRLLRPVNDEKARSHFLGSHCGSPRILDISELLKLCLKLSRNFVNIPYKHLSIMFQQHSVITGKVRILRLKNG